MQFNASSNLSESKTITLPIPQVLKPLKPDKTNSISKTVMHNNTQVCVKASVETNTIPDAKSKVANVQVQTITYEHQIKQAGVQTVEDKVVVGLKQNILSLNQTIERQSKELAEAFSLVQQRTKENLVLNAEKVNMEASVQTLKSNNNYKERLNEKLQIDIDEMRNELDNFKASQMTESNKKRDAANNENKSLLVALNQLEDDKNAISAQYKELMNNVREEYSKTIKDLNIQNMELQSKLDR